ncbi:MAG: TRAP transporter substrate-binding protein DctP, partial [Candidatus Competibacteraceae bacterium]|nr:TRAP transporter substrate-binding protein DctP [Candidatus Competibacteraceae bacterium]
NLRPVSVPADLQGMKIRTTPNPAHVKAFELLGANPTPMPFAELYVALQTGTVDGQENPVVHIYNSRLHEVQKYLSLTAHAYTAAPLVMNLPKFNSLSPEHQQLLLTAAHEAVVYERQLNQEQAEESLAKIKQAGLEVVETPDTEAFRAIVAEPTRALYSDQFGTELLDKIDALR